MVPRNGGIIINPGKICIDRANFSEQATNWFTHLKKPSAKKARPSLSLKVLISCQKGAPPFKYGLLPYKEKEGRVGAILRWLNNKFIKYHDSLPRNNARISQI